jgi:type IV pilus assembly protein PilO
VKLSPTLRKAPLAVKLVVVVIGLVVLAVAGYFLLIQPKKNEAKNLSSEIAAIDTQIQESNAQAQRAAGLSKIRVADYFKLETAMPSNPKVDELDLQINALARDTGISFDSITPGSASAATNYEVLPLTLVFEGNFYDLSDFIRRLQSLVLVDNGRLNASGRLFTIDQIEFAQGSKGFPQITATIHVDGYSFGVTAATSSAAGTGGSATGTSPTSTSTTTSTETTTPSSVSSAAASSAGEGGTP